METNEKARFHGLTEDDLDVLYIITRWYNGRSMTIGDETRNIATHQELPLVDMFDGVKQEYTEYEEAHQHLLDQGFLTEGWICRRKIDWLPTEQCLRAIRDVFKGRAEELNLRPRWTSPDDDGPIYGDPNELLHHRKGVEVAGRFFDEMYWAFRVTYYPATVNGEKGDLKVKTAQKLPNIEVEVITNTNNADQWVEKWTTLQDNLSSVWWLFENRTAMCSFFNTLHSEGVLSLDGGQLSQPYKQWAPESVYRKLIRSEGKGEYADTFVRTLTSALEADIDTMQEWFEEFFQDCAGAVIPEPPREDDPFFIERYS